MSIRVGETSEFETKECRMESTLGTTHPPNVRGNEDDPEGNTTGVARTEVPEPSSPAVQYLRSCCRLPTLMDSCPLLPSPIDYIDIQRPSKHHDVALDP